MEENKALVNDLTTGSVTKTLLAFSWPLMLSNLLQIVYSMVDMVIVGRFVGHVGLSAVSCGGDLLNIATILCMGFVNAAQIMISQHLGLQNRGGVRKTIGTLLSFVAVMSLVAMGAGMPTVDWMLGAVNVPPEAFAQARQYSVCCFLGMPFIFGYNAVSAILRGMGDSKRPLLFIAVAAGSNLVLDLLFVAGLGWGAPGAALATVIGQAISLVTSLTYLLLTGRRLALTFGAEALRSTPPRSG